MWLLSLWLIAAPSLPDRGKATGVYRTLYDLAGYFGAPVVFAAVSVTAYIVGLFANAVSYVVDPWRRLRHKMPLLAVTPQLLRRRRVDDKAREAVLAALSKRFVDDAEFRSQLERHVRDIQQQTGQQRPPPTGPLADGTPEELTRRALGSHTLRRCLLRAVVDVHRIADDVKDDLRHVPPRLVGTDAAELYDEYDRLVAEAQFRYLLLAPTAVLFIVLGVQLHPLWYLGLGMSVMLGYLGTEARAESECHLLAAISAGRIASPVIIHITSEQIAFTDDPQPSTDPPPMTPPNG